MKDEFYDDLDPTVLEKGEDEGSNDNVFTEEEKTRVVKHTTPAYAWLIGISRGFSGKKFDVKQGVTSIGRSGTNDIVIGDDSVSKEHAKIKYVEDKDTYKIYDLVSTNGTYVNDQKVEAPIELKDGDTVTIGEIDLVFKRVKIRKVKKHRIVENAEEDDKNVEE